MNLQNPGQSRGSANPRNSNTSQTNLALNASARNPVVDGVDPSAHQYQAILKENDLQRRKIAQLEQERRNLDTQLFQSQQNQASINQQHAKELEEWRMKVATVQSDRTNSKEMKEILEDEIEKMKSQRNSNLEQHQQELKAMRDRQGSLMEDLTEQKRKYDHLHFYLERNTKQFEFEEEQLKSQLKVKEQEVINLEKQLRLNGPQTMSRDQVSNLVAENENLRQRMSEMAKQLSSFSDLERKFKENQTFKLESETQALEQKLRLEQEKHIRQRTLEIEQEVSRLNQELTFAKNNAQIAQNENAQMKESVRQMSSTVAQSVEEIQQWKERYQQATAASNSSQEILILRNELRNKDQVIKEQEEQIQRLANDLANYKREYERSVNRPSVSEQDKIMIERLKQDNQQLNEQLQELAGEFDKQKKKSSKPQQQAGQNDDEVRERNQLLEAKHRQLTSTIVELESRLARLGEGPSKLGQSSALNHNNNINNSQRNTLAVENVNYSSPVGPSQFAHMNINPNASTSMQYNYYPSDANAYNSPAQLQQQRNSIQQGYQVGGQQLTNSQVGGGTRNINIYESVNNNGPFRY